MVVLVLVTVLIRYLRNRGPKELPMDEMEGHDFEYYCADLLVANGFLEVEVT